jgi:aminoglycoside phosphotransferase (APT) family kinase protein
MMIADAVKTILAHAMPGSSLREATALGDRTLLLSLGGGKQVVLRLGADQDAWAGDPLAAEAAALTALRAEIDLPLPELLAYDDGAGMGRPYLLCSHLGGMPLPDTIDEIDEDGRYDLGRELGTLMTRVHSYLAASYGPLSPTTPPGPRRPTQAGDLSEARHDDVDYLAARVERGIDAALAAGNLDGAAAEGLRAWLATNLAGSGQAASLVHGDLRPERVLLRRRERGWRIAGLVGWGYAQSWRPGWDHAALMEHFAGSDYFGLRVGYGNAYDESTERRYDQLREFALLPFRLALFLEAGRADLALGLIGQGETP